MDVDYQEIRKVMRGLTRKQTRFVIEYPVDSNGTQAAIRAGYSEATAYSIAHELLNKPEIQAAIDEREAELAAMAGLTVENTIKEWLDIATADPNEICYTRIECCRYCHGVEHRYQFTEHEFLLALEAAARHVCGKKCQGECSKRLPPDGLGGFGFNPKTPPADDCPVCHGDGIPQVKFRDTTNLRGAARRLYAGVKQTQAGIEIKFRDQDAARQNLAKYQRLLVDRAEISAPGGGPVGIAVFNAKDLSDDQLAAVIASRSAGSVIGS